MGKLIIVIVLFLLPVLQANAATDTPTNTSQNTQPLKKIHKTSHQTHQHKKPAHQMVKTVHHSDHAKSTHASARHATVKSHTATVAHATKPVHHSLYARAEQTHHGAHQKSQRVHHHTKHHHLASNAYSSDDVATPHTIAITPSQLASYENYPTDVKRLVLESMQLAKQNLGYHFGSDNPKNKAMDCSGTVSYLLKEMHIYAVPRDSEEIYEWVKHKGEFHFVSNHDFTSSDFAKIKPGDLLFWKDTYRTHRSIPITHVMIYLGKNQYQEPLMFGANSGRHAHQRIWGVSVFNMLPSIAGRHFVGYGCIPGLNCE